jgi:hypothetical protein
MSTFEPLLILTLAEHYHWLAQQQSLQSISDPKRDDFYAPPDET